jgi:hypothetical protein
MLAAAGRSHAAMPRSARHSKSGSGAWLPDPLEGFGLRGMTPLVCGGWQYNCRTMINIVWSIAIFSKLVRFDTKK